MWMKVKGLAVLVLALLAISSAPQGAQENDAALLEKTLGDLRRLRSAYYERKRERRREIAAARTAVKKLCTDVEELLEEGARLDGDITALREEVSRLEGRGEELSAWRSEADAAIEVFTNGARRRLSEGIPFRVDARVRALDAIRSGDQVFLSVADSLGRLWSFFQHELRAARSGEIYAGEIPLAAGRRKHARILRIGNQVLGFVTEDGAEAGLWIEGEGWVEARSRATADAVRTAIEILERRRAPAWVSLPVGLESARPQ